MKMDEEVDRVRADADQAALGGRGPRSGGGHWIRGRMGGNFPIHRWLIELRGRERGPSHGELVWLEPIRSGFESRPHWRAKIVYPFGASEWCFHEARTNIHHHQFSHGWLARWVGDARGQWSALAPKNPSLDVRRANFDALIHHAKHALLLSRGCWRRRSRASLFP